MAKNASHRFFNTVLVLELRRAKPYEPIMSGGSTTTRRITTRRMDNWSMRLLVECSTGLIARLPNHQVGELPSRQNYLIGRKVVENGRKSIKICTYLFKFVGFFQS